ncbi:hypothetical protein K461DRAFT_242725 [Myriangium duriaei CBS 260.36]|uniref:Anthranilate phosphoribosyltransferase n=1 Tax=Myriangium duriaei CBS 260.36 TaxID=1168546 RepID=A0A9P4IXZ9_9PEZI|nr:hypothetical protein K461DRAFT_242725 [Myriangium duriaei CBS 260.36]
MSEIKTPQVSIAPLLLQLANPTTTFHSIPAIEVAAAVSLIFTNSISPVQAGCLLYALHSTQLDRRPDILAACANAMRDAAGQVDTEALKAAVHDKSKSLSQGSYKGGLVDIVGTGGDSHNTYNVSTTTSIIVSPLLLVAKHGNNASTSKSGSADLLLNTSPAPSLSACAPSTLPQIYPSSNYAFLYARSWHPGMRHAASVRRELPFRTIFNLLGPLSNPLQSTGLLSARVLGVAKRDMGPVFADALRLSGAHRALVVCGAEDLDELSCAGPTYCWRLQPSAEGTVVVPFTVTPEDLGLKRYPLATVAGGKSPAENAGILADLLDGKLDLDGPIATFVLINAAALLAISGVCDAEKAEDGGEVDGTVGPGGLRWREGVRRAKWCITSGRAREEWGRFVKVTQEVGGEST